MNPAFPPLITCPPPQVRFGMIHVAERGKDHQESRVNAARAMHAAGDRSPIFQIEKLDANHIAVVTGRDLEERMKKGKRLEVIA